MLENQPTYSDRSLPNWLDRGSKPNADALISFSFDGKPMTGRKGESVAAALIGADVHSFRKSREGQHRGLYCGMGTCFECLLTIDGDLSQRACLVSVKEGMDIQSQAYAPAIGSKKNGKEASGLETKSLPQSSELLVIGAGPGGLAGAISAAKSGVEVIVLDERALPGGQYFKQPAIESLLIQQKAFDKQSLQGKSLVDDAYGLGVAIYSQAMVWNIVDGRDGFDVHVIKDNVNCCIATKQIIVATGAYERPFPIPGWTLPGFMTTGAVQTLLRAYRVTPGSKVLVCGNGPLNVQVASELVKGGVHVAGVIEASRPHNRKNLKALVAAIFRAPLLILKGLAYMARLRLAKVPMLYDHMLIRAEGVNRVAAAYVAEIDQDGKQISASEKRFEVDSICVGYGFIPNTDLTRLLRCMHKHDEDLGNLVVERGDDGATSRSGIFSVGDAGKLQGAQFALAQGTLAGFSVARNLGKASVYDREISQAKRRLSRHQKFQLALWTLFDYPKVKYRWPSHKSPVICRCEDVYVSDVLDAMEAGAGDIGSIKKTTRVGMGRCQGRYCGPTVIKMLTEYTHSKPDQLSGFAPQAPVKPLPLGRVAEIKSEWHGEAEGFEISRLNTNVVEVTAQSECQEAEVVVIGAGILGTCTAYYLAERGMDVVLIDRGESNGEASGNNAGSLHVQLLAYDFSAGGSDQISPAAQVLPLQRESTQFWVELEKQFDRDLGIKISGGLMVAENREQIQHLERKVEMERRLGIEVDLISGSELKNHAPWVSENMIGGAWCPEEGKINPMLATPAVLDAALSQGVRFFKNTHVLDITENSGCFEIATSGGLFKASQVVNAAGAWSPFIAAMVGIKLPARPHPIQMIVTEPVESMVEQLLAYADRHLTLKQVDNGNFIIGGGWRAGLDPMTSRPVVLQESFEGNLWVAKQVIPMLENIQVIRSWAAMNVIVDGAPILGESEQVRGFYHVVSVNGVTLGPLLGQLTAEAIRTRSRVAGIQPFTLDRFN